MRAARAGYQSGGRPGHVRRGSKSKAGLLKGDGFQMPGVFLLYHGTVLRSYRHQSAADRPNYSQLVDPQSLEMQS